MNFEPLLRTKTKKSTFENKSKIFNNSVKFSLPRLHNFHIKLSRILLVIWGLRLPLPARAHNGPMHGSSAPEV